MKKISFEPMRPEYLPQVLEIYNYYILNTTTTYYINPLSLEEMREMLFLENPRFGSFAVFSDDEIVGYCSMSHFKKREAYDLTAEVALYFRHDCIGRGLGMLAMEFIEEEAKKRGFHTLLGVISADNERSISLMDRMGYTRCAHLREVGKKFGKFLDVVEYQKILE